MQRKSPSMNCPNMLKLLRDRQIDDRKAQRVQSSLHVTESLIYRLGLEKELEGHTGCVNCLEWNEAGTVLASASDDVRFILWDPFRYRRLHVFETGHRGNIFTVKFLPKTKDNTVVTGAGDCRIRVHDVNMAETTFTCTCHTGRVKRCATAPNLPYMFWSSAEDGMIMEFDLRAPHSCNSQTHSVLINLSPHLGRYSEAKCLAINPTRPELLAVGANDPYIRLYDRRMIRPVTIEYSGDGRPRNNFERYEYMHSRVENNLPDNCVQYFVAGHLPMKQSDLKKKFRHLSCTYLTFSPSGNELLVNLGGEQIYLFDINNRRKIQTYDVKAHSEASTSGENGFPVEKKLNGLSGVKPPTVMSSVENLKLSAKTLFDREHYTSAIREYNKALSLCSNWALLYSNRGMAYMKRKWDGDVYAALRDYCVTLELDPKHMKAHFQLARCLYELNYTDEAAVCLDDFKERFPDEAHGRACKSLSLNIQTALESRKEQEKKEKASAKTEGDDDPDAPSSSSSNNDPSGQVKTSKTSEQERLWRQSATDYEARFCGHCNTTTDIKEANFFGSEGQFIVAGSDDGSFFMWDRHTTNIVQILRGDESIVNCLQPHPSACLLATSGIDPVVRLWSPLPEDGTKNDRAVMNLDDAALANQKRMNSDPFEMMLMNMGYRIAAAVNEGDESSAEEPNWVANNINCRAS